MTEPTAAKVQFQRQPPSLPPTQIAHSAPTSLIPASLFSGQLRHNTKPVLVAYELLLDALAPPFRIRH